MAEEGHNSDLTTEERNALRMHHLQKLHDLDAKIKPLQDQRKQIRGEAKGDGFKLADLDAAYRVMKMEDTSIFVAEIQEMIEIAKAFNVLAPGEQGNMFPDRRTQEEKAGDEGLVAGQKGEECSPPSIWADADLGQAWIDAWHEGQKRVRDAMQASMERKNAGKTKDNEVIPKEEVEDDDSKERGNDIPDALEEDSATAE